MMTILTQSPNACSINTEHVVIDCSEFYQRNC